MSTKRSPVLHGLRDISLEEWWRNPLIVADAIDEKLKGLPVDAAANPAFDNQVRLASRLLRAVATKSYGRISMLAVLELLLAVDYFLVLNDGRADSEDHGYDDDAEKFNVVFKKHANELQKFRVWSAQ
jgi:hypothetical protein